MRVQLCGSCPNGICGKRVNAPHELSVKASEQYIASRCAADPLCVGYDMRCGVDATQATCDRGDGKESTRREG